MMGSGKCVLLQLGTDRATESDEIQLDQILGLNRSARLVFPLFVSVFVFVCVFVFVFVFSSKFW